MNEIRKLMEQKNTKIARMTEIKDAVKNGEEMRAFTDDELAEFEQLKADVAKLTATINALSEKLEEENTETVDSETEGDMTTEERAFIDCVRTGHYETRALGTGNSGVIMPTTIANKIVDKVKELSPIYSLSEVYNIRGDLHIPCYDDSEDDIIAEFATEFTDITEHSGKFSSVTLGSWSIGALAKISNTLIANTDIDVLNFIIDKVATAIAEKIEKEGINGTATKTQGVFETAKTTTAASASAITADDLIDLQMSIPQQYQGKAVWIMHPTVLKAIRKLKNENGDYIFSKDLVKGFDYAILDKPVYVSENAPSVIEAGKPIMVYGDLSGFAVKLSRDINVQILREKYATQNATGVVAFTEIDTKITNKQKIAALVMGA